MDKEEAKEVGKAVVDEIFEQQEKREGCAALGKIIGWIIAIVILWSLF